MDVPTATLIGAHSYCTQVCLEKKLCSVLWFGNYTFEWLIEVWELVLMTFVKGLECLFVQTGVRAAISPHVLFWLLRLLLVFVYTRSWSTCFSAAEPFLTSLTMTWSWTPATATWLCWRESKARVTSACCPCLNTTTSVKWVALAAHSLLCQECKKQQHLLSVFP